MKPYIYMIIALTIVAYIALQLQQYYAFTPEKYTLINSDNLGMNFPWLNMHDGFESTNWLNVDYDPQKINADLAGIQGLGIKKIRAFMMLESVMDWDGNSFRWNESARENLFDFLNKCNAKGISIIVVMSSGNHDGNYKNLDGKFRWPLIRNQEGINAYLMAQTAYIMSIDDAANILMFEFLNEPYADLTWSDGAIASGATKEDVHNYLKQSYDNAKNLTGTPIGFSEYEEKEQARYQAFYNATNREKYIDDCTDIYSMHVYRPNDTYLADYRDLIKPKWLSEVGALNYYDPNKFLHPMEGHNELYQTEPNFDATKKIIIKAIYDEGFSAVYPWSWSSNSGMVIHNSNGSHTLLKLPLWIKYQLTE